MSGSSSAADKAELRKLQAQLRDAQDSLNDSYYSHSIDSQSQAYDDEIEAYQKSADDYIEALRNKLDNVDAMIDETLSQVLLNADVTLGELNNISSEYSVDLSSYLMNPWINAADEATNTKFRIQDELGLALNEDGVLMFSESANELLSSPFINTEPIVSNFKLSVQASVSEIQTKVYGASSDLTRDLAYPWENTVGEPLNTFSSSIESALSDAVKEAEERALDMESALTSPWENGEDAAKTWSKDVESTLNKTVENAKTKLAEINTKIADTQSKLDNLGSDDDGKDGDDDDKKEKEKEKLKASSTYMQYIGTADKQIIVGSEGYFNSQLKTINGVKYYKGSDGHYYPASYAKKQSYDGGRSTGIVIPKGTPEYRKYAKGTLGTKKDELAVTDEPQFGDELVLVPTKSGNLSFMRKGTSVVPAKLTEEIMDIANVGLDGLMNSNQTSANINMVSNAISKPELNFNVEKFLSIDKVDEGSLPEVKKFVQQELDNFVRKLNYSLKSKGAT